MSLTLSYIKAILKSPLTYISVICVAFVCYFDMMSHERIQNVIINYDAVLDIGAYRKIIIVFSCMPFVSRFCNEYNNNMYNAIIVRSSPFNYLISHIVTCFIVTFAVTFAGLSLCCGVLSIGHPFYVETGNVYSDGFEKLLNNGEHTIAFFLFKTFNYSVSIAAWSVAGLAVSSFYPNTYIAVSAPLVSSYILEMITVDSRIFPDLRYLSLSYVSNIENLWLAVGYIFLVYFVITIMFAAFFWGAAKRRIENAPY